MADIVAWLAAHGLEKFAPVFTQHEIDFDTLALLTEDDVRELGLPLGPRRRLLAALGALRSEATPSPRDDAERRQLTVMFVDLVDSTPLATRLDPEAMREILRGYQNAVAGEITRVGGHVAKLMGDGVLAYFGWPRAHEDDAERAARAGLAVVKEVSQMAGPEVEKLAARVGIATGLVVVGDLVGEGAAQEHAVVGTTPNLAARLQAEAGSGEVVIAEGTRRLLGTGFIVEAVGRRVLKGHDDPLPLFRVLREEPRERRFVGVRAASMVGREAELAALCTAWQQAGAGRGQSVLLTGEAGIGKSRLLYSLIGAVAADNPPQQFFQCSALHSENPFWPITQSLATDANIIASDDGSAREVKLMFALSRTAVDPARAAAVLWPLLGLSGAGVPPGGGQLIPSRRETIDVLTGHVLAASRAGRTLVIFEDLQWADRGTLDVFRHLVRAIVDLPVLVVATARDDKAVAFDATANLLRLPLARLDAAAARVLIIETAGRGTLSSRVVDEILGRSDGIPLFVEEITKAVVEAAPHAEGTVPSTLRDSLIARLDVSPAMKTVAQVAACIGREFEESVLRQCIDLAPGMIEEGLKGLRNAGLIAAETGGRYRFRHALLCDIAFETLLTPRRRGLHERIAKTLEARPGNPALSEPEVLARHWFGAGQYERAETYWLRARHRAVHWQDQFDALAAFLEKDASDDAASRGSASLLRTLH
jgi:class 3 adenylate cyclase